MSHIYSDSGYAHERVGFDLHCEPDDSHEWREGDMPKCIHCRDEFEIQDGYPKPCIERIALALEEARATIGRTP